MELHTPSQSQKGRTTFQRQQKSPGSWRGLRRLTAPSASPHKLLRPPLRPWPPSASKVLHKQVPQPAGLHRGGSIKLLAEGSDQPRTQPQDLGASLPRLGLPTVSSKPALTHKQQPT